MDLKGAKIRNYYLLGNEIHSEDQAPRSFTVPHFQRPFTWDKDNVESLVRDSCEHQITQAAQGVENARYFAGAIVTVIKGNAHALIDGQQRYTTLFLANYLRYLLYRAYFLVAIDQKSHRALQQTQEFARSAAYLFVNGPQNLGQKVTEFLDLVLTSPDESENAKHEFQKLIALPVLTSDHSNYLKRYQSMLADFLKNSKPMLAYDRASFNTHLREAMSRINIEMTSNTGPKLSLIESSDADQAQVRLYMEAVETLFSVFEEQTKDNTQAWNSDPKHRASLILDRIGKFLELVNVCVVQTGRDEDAYTLFEVLNDRALALDDLAIIKNYFYRTYITSNSNSGGEEESTDASSTLDELEGLWGDTIFSDTRPEFLKRLIAYLTIVYLSGAKELANERGEGLRRAVRKYLDSRTNPYSSDDIRRDFRTFNLVRIFLDKVGVVGKKKEAAVITAFNDSNASNIKRTILLLQALGMDGVITGISCAVLNKAHSHPPSTRLAWIDKLMHRDDAKVAYPKLEEFAFYLGNLVLATSDYKIPRKLISDAIIDLTKYGVPHDHLDAFSSHCRPTSEHLNGFDDWASAWQYQHKPTGLRVRVLLLELMKSELVNEKLKIVSAFPTSISNPADLTLDHVEPARPSQPHSQAYFQDPDRGRLVNGIGNMMLLDWTSNIDKTRSSRNRIAVKRQRVSKEYVRKINERLAA